MAASSTGPMTLRERFHCLMRYQPVDRLPLVAFEDLFWVHGHRWQHQGLPAACNPFVHFGFDEAGNDRATHWLNKGRGLESVEIDPYAMPRFEAQPRREDAEYFYTFDVRTGVLLKRKAGGGPGSLSVKTHARVPVETPAQWPAYRARFDPHTPERYPRVRQDHLTVYPLDYPETWEQCALDIEAATHIVQLRLGSGYNPVANAVGFERLLELLLTEPEWVQEMISHFGSFSRESRQRALETAPLDYVTFEDGTPPRTVHGELLVSPSLFMRYVEESYHQGLVCAAASGVELVEMPHTRHREFERLCLELVLEAGLTPILCADWDGEFSVAGRRRDYGTQFPMWGGMDTRVLLEGRAAIDAMVDQVFTQAADGGLMPTLGDRYGELLEVPLDHYAYYVQAFKKANGME
jgi:hypothetical protein